MEKKLEPVTYDQIYEAFCQYAASRDQSDWWDLWALCQRRMMALVKTKAKKLSVPLPEGDIFDLVADSSIRVMRVLRGANEISAEFISKTFWNENLTAFEEFNRKADQWSRMTRAARMMNEKYFKENEITDL